MRARSSPEATVAGPRRAVVDGLVTAALVVAIAAGLAATFEPGSTRILTVGFVAVAAIGWRYPAIRAALAVVAGLVLLADGLGNRPVDRLAIRLALVALVVAGVLAARARLGALRPLADPTRTNATLTRPATVVVPVIALCALVLVAFALGPDLRLGEESPRASAQLDPASAEIRDGDPTAGNRALAPYLGFSPTLDTGSRGDLGDAVVLRVEADAPDFWRGQSFDRWDGRHWSRAASVPTVTVGAHAVVAPDDEVVSEPFLQRFRVEAPAIGELFAAYRPLVIGLPASAYTYGPDGSVELRRPLGRGSEYSVTSLRPLVTPAILRAHDPRAADAVRPRTSMQGPVSARVAQLAQRITAGTTTTYDAVRAIEHWMADHTEYTTDVPPLPAGADAVDQHLFVDRRGFCVQIATSTAAMLDSLGVPVRLGVGFVPGEASPLGRTFTVREKDAHAWVEVWFPGVGWQAFDPTADVPLAGEFDSSWWAQVWRLVGRLWTPFVVLAAVAVGALAGWLLRRRARRVPPPWGADLLRRIEREGRARGRPRRPAETPAAYLAALAAGPIPATEVLVVVARTLTAAAYGARGPDRSARDAAEAAWAVAAAVPPPVRERRDADDPRQPVGV